MQDQPSLGCGCERHANGHNEDCGCAHPDHTHEHGSDCDCGHHGSSIQVTSDSLSMGESEILAALAQYNYLPVVRFVLKSSKQDDVQSIALAPVVINAPEDTMEQVKRIGGILLALEDKGLITLDYDIPLNGYDYEGYRTSDLYQYFERTVAQSVDQSGFLFDTASMEMGSMMLTKTGRQQIENRCS